MDVYFSEEDAIMEAKFFENRPEGFALWRTVVEEMDSPVAATQSRVSLVENTRYIWCPVAHAKGSIILRFVSVMPIDSPRLRVDAMQNGKTSHRVTIKELDEEVLRWLRAAKALDQA